MFSIDEAAQYLALYMDPERAHNWKAEIQKMGKNFSERFGHDWATKDIRNRTGFCVEVCSTGWQPRDPVAFFWGCSRNDDYKSKNWARALQKRMEQDQAIKNFRKELSSMESIRPDALLSYPMGRKAYNLVWKQVKKKIIPKISEKLATQAAEAHSQVVGDTAIVMGSNTIAPLRGEAITMAIQEEPGSGGLPVTTEKPSYQEDTGAPLVNRASQEEEVSHTMASPTVKGKPVNGGETLSISDQVDIAEKKWKAAICNFVSIYGAQNIVKMQEVYPQEWERVDFSSLYHVERFLHDHMSMEAILRGKVREVAKLLTHQVTSP